MGRSSKSPELFVGFEGVETTEDEDDVVVGFLAGTAGGVVLMYSGSCCCLVGVEVVTGGGGGIGLLGVDWFGGGGLELEEDTTRLYETKLAPGTGTG